MSLWFMRRLSRTNSISLEQCSSSIPQHITRKLSSPLQPGNIKQSRRLSTALSTCNNTHKDSSDLLQSADCGALGHNKCNPWNRNQCRHLRVTCTALCDDTSRKRTIKELWDDSADPTVPPAPENANVLMWNHGDYPKQKDYERCENTENHGPILTDPAQTSIILFPGEGSQYVGMGARLLHMPLVQQMYDVASEILGFDLKEASLQGPYSYLSQQQVQQPAIFVASLAAVEKLREVRPLEITGCVAAAGYGVGEITAHTFAATLTFEDAVHLIKVRAEAMQLASDMSPGGMLEAHVSAGSRLTLACTIAKQFCTRRGVQDPECAVAAYHWPTRKLVSGSLEALLFLEDNMEDFKIRKLERLKFPGAFYSYHMKPAADAVQEALKHIEISIPNINVHTNVDSKPYTNVEKIRDNLVKQIYRPVQWEQIMHHIYQRRQGLAYPKTFECGPRYNLEKLVKMVNQQAFSKMISIEA